MKRREFITLLGGAAAAWPVAARAQGERMRRVGVLMGLTEDHPDTKARLAGLQQSLEKLGWSEGRNVRIDYRFAPAGTGAQVLAKELVALQPDVILGNASPATRALQLETDTIPIVFTGVADPIGSGFVASLARPGGNITGLLLFEASITGKWLAMLKEIAPNLGRAALAINPKTAPYYEFYLGPAQAAASTLGIELVLSALDSAPANIERALDALARAPNSGLILPPDTNTRVHLDLIIGLAARHRLPAVYPDRQFVAAGGLVCYSTDRVEQIRRAASYVDRIPAKALGLAVPDKLLVAADGVIE